MKFNLGSKVKKLIQNWLEIIPATDQTIVLQEKLSRELETLRSQIWYRGDASELHQFFKQLQFNSGGFWACAPNTNKVRKIHSGLPAVIVDFSGAVGRLKSSVISKSSAEKTLLS